MWLYVGTIVQGHLLGHRPPQAQRNGVYLRLALPTGRGSKLRQCLAGLGARVAQPAMRRSSKVNLGSLRYALGYCRGSAGCSRHGLHQAKRDSHRNMSYDVLQYVS